MNTRMHARMHTHAHARGEVDFVHSAAAHSSAARATCSCTHASNRWMQLLRKEGPRVKAERATPHASTAHLHTELVLQLRHQAVQPVELIDHLCFFLQHAAHQHAVLRAEALALALAVRQQRFVPAELLPEDDGLPPVLINRKHVRVMLLQ